MGNLKKLRAHLLKTHLPDPFTLFLENKNAAVFLRVLSGKKASKFFKIAGLRAGKWLLKKYVFMGEFGCPRYTRADLSLSGATVCTQVFDI